MYLSSLQDILTILTATVCVYCFNSSVWVNVINFFRCFHSYFSYMESKMYDLYTLRWFFVCLVVGWVNRVSYDSGVWHALIEKYFVL